MGMSSGGDNNGMMAEINVTPFVDVMLVLLIIFMVTAPMMNQGVQVQLPKASADQLPLKKISQRLKLKQPLAAQSTAKSRTRPTNLITNQTEIVTHTVEHKRTLSRDIFDLSIDRYSSEINDSKGQIPDIPDLDYIKERTDLGRDVMKVH